MFLQHDVNIAAVVSLCPMRREQPQLVLNVLTCVFYYTLRRCCLTFTAAKTLPFTAELSAASSPHNMETHAHASSICMNVNSAAEGGVGVTASKRCNCSTRVANNRTSSGF